MGKKLVWIVATIFVILIIGYFIFNSDYQTQTTKTNDQQTETQNNTQTESSAQVKEVTVEGTEFSFNPPSISINQGETIKITFKNIGNVNHNFGIPELDIRTKTISSGSSDTIEFVASQTGTFGFDCSIAGHKENGMSGSLEII